jgi:hypothetical protein
MNPGEAVDFFVNAQRPHHSHRRCVIAPEWDPILVGYTNCAYARNDIVVVTHEFGDETVCTKLYIVWEKPEKVFHLKEIDTYFTSTSIRDVHLTRTHIEIIVKADKPAIWRGEYQISIESLGLDLLPEV